MKGFEFLEKSDYFESKEEYKNTTFYIFRDNEKSGRIMIPKKMKEMSWQFWATNDMFATHSSGWEWHKNVDTLPVWFRELILEAEKVLKRRDKIRKLFMKGR